VRRLCFSYVRREFTITVTGESQRVCGSCLTIDRSLAIATGLLRCHKDGCTLTRNLWLCLRCGHVGCGRQSLFETGPAITEDLCFAVVCLFFESMPHLTHRRAGGAGHALEHFQRLGADHSIACKGTHCPELATHVPTNTQRTQRNATQRDAHYTRPPTRHTRHTRHDTVVGTLDGKDPAQTDIHCYRCSDAVGGGRLVWHLLRLGFHFDAFRKTEMVPWSQLPARLLNKPDRPPLFLFYLCTPPTTELE
jgi:hypothetical protein